MSKLGTTPMSMSNLPYVKPLDGPGIPRSSTTADMPKIRQSKSQLISDNSAIIAEPVSDIPVIDRLQSDVIVHEVKSAIGDEFISDQNKQKLSRISSQANLSATQSNSSLARLEGYVDFNEKRVTKRLIRSGLISSKPASKSMTRFDVDAFVARDQEFIKQRKAKSQEQFFDPEELNKSDGELNIRPPPEDFLERNRKYIEEKMKYADEDSMQAKTPSPVKYTSGYKIRRQRRSIFDVQKGKDLIRSPKKEQEPTEEEEEKEDPEVIERRRERTYRLAKRALKRRAQKLEEQKKREEEEKLQTPEKPKPKPKKISSPAYLSFYISAKEAYKAKYDNKEMMVL